MIEPTKITRADFDKALGRYSALIESISEQKAAKSRMLHNFTSILTYYQNTLNVEDDLDLHC